MQKFFFYVLLLSLSLVLVKVNASQSSEWKRVYQTEKDFLNQTFNGEIPKWKFLMLDQPLKDKLKTRFRYRFKGRRVRYWKKGDVSAWIFNEIGKEMPITFGVVINDNEIEKIKVLIYREDRGYEVSNPMFSQQFNGSKLKENNLTNAIDGITGATLSVNAMKRVAKTALFLNETTPDL